MGKKTAETTKIALMVALMTICAWICIPLGAQPFTMQTFAVFVTAGLLGAKSAVIAVLAYILLGAVGLPVYNGMQGGIGILLGNTGGYMVGFLSTALIVGFAAKKFRGNRTALFISMVLGTVVCYTFGTVWFMAMYASGSGAVGIAGILALCVFPFVVPDIVKMLLAIVVIKRVAKYI